MLVQDDVVVVDGCRAVTVLDAATGQVLLETEDVEDAGAVVGRVLVGSARRQADDAPGWLGVRLDGASGGFSWSKVVGSAGVTPSPVTRVGSGFAVAFGDSLDVVADPVVAADPRTAVQLPSDVVGTPVALSDGVVLAATADGSVYGIRDGALRWRVVPELVGARVSTALTARRRGRPRVVLDRRRRVGDLLRRPGGDGALAHSTGGCPRAASCPPRRRSRC